MSIRIVKITDIKTIKGRPKYAQIYEQWFAQALTLKKGEALEITLDKSNPTFPSPRAAVLAVKRWNQNNPKQQMKCRLKDSRTDRPILYLFAQGWEEAKREKSEKAS